MRKSIGILNLFFSALDQLNFVSFRRIDKGDQVTTFGPVRSVRKGVALAGGVSGKLVHIVDLKSEMRKIRADNDRSALVEFAKLDLFFALGSFQKNKSLTR